MCSYFCTRVQKPGFSWLPVISWSLNSAGIVSPPSPLISCWFVLAVSANGEGERRQLISLSLISAAVYQVRDLTLHLSSTANSIQPPLHRALSLFSFLLHSFTSANNLPSSSSSSSLHMHWAELEKHPEMSSGRYFSIIKPINHKRLSNLTLGTICQPILPTPLLSPLALVFCKDDWHSKCCWVE